MDATRRDLLDGPARRRDLASIEEFLAVVRAEQQRYLLTIEDTRCRLDQADGQFAQVAAIHTRLTRQFFDAQRMLLRHRAEVEARVSEIAASTEARAEALEHAAREQAETGSVDLDTLQLPVSTAGLPAAAARTVRQQIAQLGVDVVRTSGDADAVRDILDGAFEPDDPDAATAESALRGLLDGWWDAAQQEGKALVDDAEARAAMRMHLAGLTALDTLDTLERYEERAIPVASDPSPTADEEAGAAPPPRLMEVPGLDTLGDLPANQWGAVLDDMLSSLESSAPRPPEQPVVGDLRIREDVIDVPPQEAFRRFWNAPEGSAGAPDRRWSPVRLVVPMVGVSTLFVLALAWVG